MSELSQYDNAAETDDTALRHDVELLVAMAENSNEVITVLDTQGCYRYASPSITTALGWQPEELVGRNSLEIVHPDDVSIVSEALAQIAQPPHTPQTVRFRFAQSDGVWRLMESTGRIVKRTGKPTVYLAHSRDITDQEDTDQALRDSEERYRQLIDNSPDAIIAHTQGVIVFANAAAAELFAAESPEHLVGHRAADIIHPEDLPGMRERVQQALSQGQHAALREERMVRLDGEEIWVEAKGVLTTIKGQPSIQAVIRDVSQRRAAMLAEQRRAKATRLLYEIASQAESDIDNQLEQSLALAASLIDMESGTISECDTTTCFVTHHYGPAHTSGGGVELPLAQTYCSISMEKNDLVAIADITNSHHADHPAVRRLPQQSYIGMPLYLHGGLKGVLGFSSAKPRARGFDEVDCDLLRIMGRWVEFALDRRNASHALESANKDLSRSNEELQQFAYIASHDLKEPLRAVTTYLQLLGRRHRDNLNDEAREFMDFAITGATRMQNLIQDLLEFSRVGTHSDSAVNVSLNQIVQQAQASLTDVIEATGTLINAEPLPTVIAHEGLLLQLLQNLISNAIKYRHPDTPPRLLINCVEDGKSLRINIIDNGIGVAEEHRERIFQMFRRLHNHEQYEGTGIGLAIAKRIVERHGGEIGVEAAPEGGSCFYFTLPKA